MATPSAFATGVGLALVAAVFFGLTTPAIAWAGRGLGALTTVMLLYAGAAASAAVLRALTLRSGRALTREAAPRLVAMAVLGAVVGPALLVSGIARAGALATSLMLCFEAPFTVLLACAIYREPIGTRVTWAVLAMLAGGILLAADLGSDVRFEIAGLVAVLGAAVCWAADNVLSRGLAEEDPFEVIASKGALGALTAGLLARASGEEGAALWQAAALLACGAIGYGLSLRFYLLAQRRMGAARTSSVFATGPFVGAIAAWVVGERGAGLATIASVAAFATGVYLHARERHGHEHAHEPLEHAHPHRHDDGHHDHAHAAAIVGEHSHPHRHERLVHAHDHAPDIHHRHDHR